MWPVFFLFESLQNFFSGLYSEFSWWWPWDETIFICYARYLVDAFILETCVLLILCSSNSVHCFIDFFPLQTSYYSYLDILGWSSTFLIFFLLFSISLMFFSTSQELTLSLYFNLFIKFAISFTMFFNVFKSFYLFSEYYLFHGCNIFSVWDY